MNPEDIKLRETNQIANEITEKEIYIVIKGVKFKRITEEFLLSEDGVQAIFNGYFFRWNNFYYVSARTPLNPCSTLHRYVWMFYNGPIPEKHHVHHVDGNRRNNHISNLRCVLGSQHQSEHMLRPESWAQSERCKQVLRSLNAKATEWHRSEEGREWHRNHAQKSLPACTGKKYKKICKCCSKEFFGEVAHQLFCSNACKTKNRVIYRKDFIYRACCVCTTLFFCNKYALKKTCSKKCAIVSMLKTRNPYLIK
jgi:hypothetical protein